MAYVNLASTTKASRSTALNTAIGSSCSIEIRTGSAPTNPDTTASGTLLATLTGNASGFGTVSGAGVLTAGAITQANAVATGTAGYCRIKTSGGTAIMDLDVNTTGSSVIMNTTSIVSGGPVQITSAVITEA